MNLKLLYQQKETKMILEDKLSQLYLQKNNLETKVKQLYTSMLKEQEDVQRLDKGGLTTKFFELTGKFNQKKEKEEHEAYQAKVNYQSTSYQLEVLKKDIDHYEHELNTLKNCEKEYQKRFDLVYNYLLQNDIESSILDEYKAYMLHFGPIEETMNSVKESRKLVTQLRNKLKELDNHNMEDMLGNDYASVEYENHKNKTNVLNEIKSLGASLQQRLLSLNNDIHHHDLSIEISEDFLENDFLEMPFSSFSTIKLIGKLQDQLLDIALELKNLQTKLEEPYTSGILKKEKLYQHVENFVVEYDETHPDFFKKNNVYDEKQIIQMKTTLQEGKNYLSLLKELLVVVEEAEREAGEDVFRKKSLLGNKFKYDSFDKMNQKTEEVKVTSLLYHKHVEMIHNMLPLQTMDVSRKTQDYFFDNRIMDYKMFKNIENYRIELEKYIETLTLELSSLEEKIND